MKLKLAKLHDTAAVRFPEDRKAREAYVKDVLSSASVEEDGYYEISQIEMRRLREKYGPRSRLGSSPPSIEPSTKPSENVGDKLKAIIEDRFGALPDQGATCSCKEMIRKMNQWGVDGCEDHREEIVEHLIGQSHMLPKSMRMAMKLPGGKRVARREAEKMVDEAIENAREK